MIEKEFPSCILIKSSKNLGFVKANNIAMIRAKGEFVLLLNPDTALKTNAIMGMMDFMRKRYEYGAIGCKLLNSDGTIQFICARTFPTPLNQFCFLAMLDRLFSGLKLFSTVEMRYWDHMSSREVDCLSGACIFTKREWLISHGGFDENIFMYAEDVDLCYRIKQSGLKIYYLADEEITHHSGASSAQRSQSFFSAVLQRESNYYFFNKHYGKYKAEQYRLAVFLGSAIRVLFVIFLMPYFLLFKNESKDPMNVLRKYIEIFLWAVRYKKIDKKIAT